MGALLRAGSEACHYPPGQPCTGIRERHYLPQKMLLVEVQQPKLSIERRLERGQVKFKDCEVKLNKPLETGVNTMREETCQIALSGGTKPVQVLRKSGHGVQQCTMQKNKEIPGFGLVCDFCFPAGNPSVVESIRNIIEYL